MGYTPTAWLKRIVEFPDRYTLTDLGGGLYTITPSEGTVTQAGTAMTEAALNNLETQYDEATVFGFTKCDTEAFSGNSPGASAWTDLDLSGTIGARASLVFLRVTNGVAEAVRIAFRPNGETEMTTDTEGPNKAANFYDPIGSQVGIVIVLTDASGIVEWYHSGAAKATTIDIIGYTG